VVGAADVLITILPGSQELHDVMLMPGGALAALPAAAALAVPAMPCTKPWDSLRHS
jgi:hypothetical protein